MKKWMIYGVYGYTGRLILEESIKKGLSPILAGRNASRLKTMAEETGLEWRAFTLEDEESILKGLSGVNVVLNAAGPFVNTAMPLVQACLKSGVHYVDITGEIQVFHKIFELHKEAVEKKVLLAPGAGFDVVPTDCLAKKAYDEMDKKCDSLKIAFFGLSKVSRGTLRTMFSSLKNAFLVRKNGKLTPITPGSGVEKIPFPGRNLTCMPIAWGDLETAYRTTGVENISTLMAVPSYYPVLLKVSFPMLKFISSVRFLRDFIEGKFISRVEGPDEDLRRKGRAFITVIASNPFKTHVIMGETPEPYHYTALSSVKCIEKILNGNYIKGALTPSLAFGSSLFEETGGKILLSETTSPHSANHQSKK